MPISDKLKKLINDFFKDDLDKYELYLTDKDFNLFYDIFIFKKNNEDKYIGIEINKNNNLIYRIVQLRKAKEDSERFDNEFETLFLYQLDINTFLKTYYFANGLYVKSKNRLGKNGTKHYKLFFGDIECEISGDIAYKLDTDKNEIDGSNLKIILELERNN